MATDKKITEMNPVVTPAGSDPFASVNEAETKRITLAQILGAQTSPGKFTTLESNDTAGICDAPLANIGLTIQPSTQLSGVSQLGLSVEPTAQSDATTQVVGITTTPKTDDASFTCASMIGMRVYTAVKGAASTITNFYGLKVETQSASFATGAYGLHIGDITGGGSLNRAIQTGSGLVQFGDNLFLSDAAGPTLLNVAATSTVPTVIPNRANPNTGIGWQGADYLSLIAGGSEVMRLGSSIQTLSGDFTVNNGDLYLDRQGEAVDAILYISGDEGQNRGFVFRTGTSSRWGFTCETTAEGGGDSGSGFSIISYTDAGAFKETPFKITRSSGLVTLKEDLSVGGNLYLTNAAGPTLLNLAASSIVPTVVPNKADPNSGLGWQSADFLTIVTGGVTAAGFEDPANLAAGETSLWLYDDDNDTVEQVTVGAPDSGGTDYKLLRIPN